MEDHKYIHTTDVHNTIAAEAIVPVLMDWFHPTSVIDIGCGLGTWLYVFKSHGVEKILGVDGNHLDTNLVVINKDDLLLINLEEEFVIDRKFDLAISLEVAEHLSESSADHFIKSLTKLSDVIVFSAAIPGQGGQNHINEKWIGYWQSRFAKYDFLLSDEIRPLFWNNEKIEWWYRQNMVIAIKKGTLVPFRGIKSPLDLVHPELFLKTSLMVNFLNEINNTNVQSIADLKKENNQLENENSLLKIKSLQTESELETIYNSITWKLARKFIIKPGTMIMKILRRNSIS